MISRDPDLPVHARGGLRCCAAPLSHADQRVSPIRQLRELTRYRRSLIRERTGDKQRREKLLKDAQIKLSTVISDIFGVLGRCSRR
jgi:hypothetical protein